MSNEAESVGPPIGEISSIIAELSFLPDRLRPEQNLYDPFQPLIERALQESLQGTSKTYKQLIEEKMSKSVFKSKDLTTPVEVARYLLGYCAKNIKSKNGKNFSHKDPNELAVDFQWSMRQKTSDRGNNMSENGVLSALGATVDGVGYKLGLLLLTSVHSVAPGCIEYLKSPDLNMPATYKYQGIPDRKIKKPEQPLTYWGWLKKELLSVLREDYIITKELEVLLRDNRFTLTKP